MCAESCPSRNPRRSRIYELPAAIREELEARLGESGYGSLDEHVEWLAGQGYEISRSSVWRYIPAARSINTVLARLRASAAAAGAVIEVSSADVSEAGRRVMAETIFRLATADDLTLGDLDALSEAAARIGGQDAKARQLGIAAERLELQRARLALEQERQRGLAEERELRARELAASVDRLAEDAAGHNAGVSPEAIAALRAAILEGM
jgi:hypothetical protein